MSLILIQILNGLQYGLLLFLAASGLTLVFGILGVINLAHGSFYMLGAYAALTLTAHFGDIFIALATGVPLGFAFGAAIEWLFIRHLYKRDHLQQVLLTFALILVFNELQQTVWGNYPHSIPMPSYLSASVSLTEQLGYPVYRIALMAICVVLAVAMMLVIQRTRVGRLIRRASIDELPQLWCVLTGDMTLVGPRPPLPREVARYAPDDRLRLSVTPGLTCIWQVSGRARIPFPEQVSMDLEYIRERSIALDLKLLCRTVPAVIRGQGAY